MVERAIRLDGTCTYQALHVPRSRVEPSLRVGTGEHGVGIGKKDFLIEELGEGTVNLMKTIKRAVDPLCLFNPGKVHTLSAVTLCATLIQFFLCSVISG